jgi:hypothetical protein
MKCQITATAPTHYQINSLNAFNLENVKGLNGSYNGSYTGVKIFDSVKDAKEYLTTRAVMYNDADPCGSKQRLANMCKDIKRGYLTLDAVTAHII